MPDRQNYQKLDWNGHDLYQCSACPWDCLDDEGLMKQHQAAVHGPHGPTTAAQVGPASNRER